MKIAYFLDIPKGLGGAGNLLLQRAALMSEIHDVIVVIPSDGQGRSNDEYIRRCMRHNLRYVCIEYSTAYSFTMVDYKGAVNSAEEIERFAKDEGIEFFHSVQLNLAAEYVSRKLKIPNLMDIYSIDENEFKICINDICPQFHLCDSQMYSDLWRKHLKIESRCIRPVAPLNDIKMKSEYGYKSMKILTIGNICSYKNQLAAIKAFSECRRYFNGMELHFLGDDSSSYAKECRRYVEENLLGDAVFFHGFVNDIEEYLKDSDCLLCTSTRESFPFSMVEALTYDLTIISTPVAGVPEVFVDKKNAFISRDFSEEAITSSILECIEYYQNGRIQEIHDKARETWFENFDRKVVRKQLDAYYNEIKNRKIFQGTVSFDAAKADIAKIEALLNTVDDLGETWIHRRGYYYLAVKRALKKGKIYIWGAGKWGKIAVEILNALCPNLEVAAFIDNEKKGSLNGLPIKRFDDIECNGEFLYSVSFAKEREDAIQRLKNKGLGLYDKIWNLP